MNSKLTILTFLAVLVTLFQPLRLTAQDKIQVVVRSLEKQVSWDPKSTIRINGEKADLSVKGWDKNFINVVIKLIAKHPDRSIAVKEIEYLNYVINSSGGYINISNFITLKKGIGKVESNLKAQIILMVPRHCTIEINNKYGQIDMNGLELVNSNCVSQFSTVTLGDLGGILKMTSSYDEITATTSRMALDIKSSNSDLKLSTQSGRLDIKMSYGSLLLKTGENMRAVNVGATYSSVECTIQSPEKFNYHLVSLFGEIQIMNELLKKEISNFGGRRTYHYEKNPLLPWISISTTNRPLIIR